MKHYKIQDFKDDYDNYQKVVRITDFEHFFNVYEDKMRNRKVYNLNATMYFDIDKDSMLQTEVQHDTYWPMLSYQIYSTPRLAWLLMKLNGVKAEDALKPVYTGTVVYYLDQIVMQDIIQQLN